MVTQKLRIVVMNGQKIIQALVNNEWETTGTIKKVEEGIKPGIYNIYLAQKPEDKKQYEGKILYVDKENEVFYQQTGKDFIVHQINAINGKPVAGNDVVVEYDGEKANIAQNDSLKKKRVLKI
ncbi:MAG: conjugal transfer protein TraO [Nitrosomonas sp. PRO4]|uniref:Cell filamentation protein n=1 Tax=Nitrosomonas nitrosa TaxID=52442 RepID=A0A8H9D9A0_9PROT|nr:KfrB domain-containing protein [Nitrosomonas nitrosa]MCB1934910.1 conjugal transfer protein TraO [Nitrosomonas sp.]MCE7913966.1 conjugal transfer protein TraO [Nitrosomonas sp. PRO4]CAE6507948.1 Cell filamentation protein [Nitrosomonas nitrosa]